MRFKFVERRPLEHGGMGCFQHQPRCFPGVKCLFPAGCAETPLVALDKTLEPEGQVRCGQVVSLGLAELQEVVGYPGTHHVDTGVVGSGVTTTIPVEAGERILRAGLQISAEHVLGHAAIGADGASTVHNVAADQNSFRSLCLCSQRLWGPALASMALLLAACSGLGPDIATETTDSGTAGSDSGAATSLTVDDRTGNDEPDSEQTTSQTAPTITRPDWLGQRPLATNSAGFGIPQPTPEELRDRILPTIDTLPPPARDEFSFTIAPLTGEPLTTSTWEEGCPVPPEDLRYITLTFRGFDGLSHVGELIVNAEWAEQIVEVFRQAWLADYPFEEMRIVTPADLEAEPTGDGNNTASFVCRAVTGGSRFSQHAYGLAIDINPFHNPYVRGNVILPELADSYIERDDLRVGMLTADHPVVLAFKDMGWAWGGDWNSLKDWQHFSNNGL